MANMVCLQSDLYNSVVQFLFSSLGWAILDGRMDGHDLLSIFVGNHGLWRSMS